MRATSVSLFWSLTCGLSLAQPAVREPIDMHQVELAKPFAHEPGARRLPDPGGFGFFTFAAPNKPGSKAPFVSYQVAIFEEAGVVYYVRATRPFVAHQECRTHMSVLKDIEKSISDTKTLKDDYSRYEARRGGEHVVIGCSMQAGSPYFDLEFMRRSNGIYERLNSRPR